MERSNADIIHDAWGQLFLHTQGIEEELKRKWSTLGNEISFAGVSAIYKYFRGKISKKKIEEVLSTLPTYTKYKEKRRPAFHNPIFIYYKHQIWGIDLVYVKKWKGYNDGIQYLLTVLESFSRKLFIIPMRNKTAETTVSSFKLIHKHIGENPRMVYADKGGEFQSTNFIQYCESNKINLVFSESPYKSSMVERAQRTLENIMYKHMHNHNTKRYIDSLKAIVHTFNSRVNRRIGLSPNKAYHPENKSVVLYNLEQHYRKVLAQRRKPKYHKDMKVRILRLSENRHFSRKAFTPNFTDEVFTIYKVCNRLPFTRYYIKDQNNEQIKGSFQAYELTPVR